MESLEANVLAGRTILLADDDQLYLEAMKLLLGREGYRVLCATDGPRALDLLRENGADLVIVDSVMPGMSGEEVVRQLRQFNPYVQVILQTGYARQRPMRRLLRDLNIQGYSDKGEGVDRFLLWVEICLREAATVQSLNANRQALRYIAEAAPALQRIQPLDDLLQEILERVAGLLSGAAALTGTLRAPLPAHGFVATQEDDQQLVIRAALGDRFVRQRLADDCLPEPALARLKRALLRGELDLAEGASVVPLRGGGVMLGAAYVETAERPALDAGLVQIYAAQAATAIQNTQLYELATLDPLTGVYARRFFDQWLVRVVRTAFRDQQPLALLLIDLDGLHLINDTAGRAAGDLALATLGNLLRHAVRPSDVVGRYGGDEFAVILPQTPDRGGESMGLRILELARSRTVFAPGGALALASSLGLGALNAHTFAPADGPLPAEAYFEEIAQVLALRADEALYQAKREGGNRLCVNPLADWPVPKTSAVFKTSVVSKTLGVSETLGVSRR